MDANKELKFCENSKKKKMGGGQGGWAEGSGLGGRVDVIKFF